MGINRKHEQKEERVVSSGRTESGYLLSDKEDFWITLKRAISLCVIFHFDPKISNISGRRFKVVLCLQFGYLKQTTISFLVFLLDMWLKFLADCFSVLIGDRAVIITRMSLLWSLMVLTKLTFYKLELQ